jgi:hypothetical protein
MEINIKLHLAELVRGMEERAAAQSESAANRRAISIRGFPPPDAVGKARRALRNHPGGLDESRRSNVHMADGDVCEPGVRDHEPVATNEPVVT